jgi:argininosuccinate lyase
LDRKRRKRDLPPSGLGPEAMGAPVDGAPDPGGSGPKPEAGGSTGNSRPVDDSPLPSQGLWGGRFREAMAPAMVPLNRSLGVDYRLWPQDVRGSQAWARALGEADVLTAREAMALVEGLERVGARLAREDHSGASDEDVHSLVERLLGEEVGSLAGKLHTGRSRNDQVATDLRLWGMDAGRGLEREIAGLLEALVRLAENGLDVVLPGYTHLQPAQPLRGAHWALSHVWPLVRDRDRLRGVRESAASLPLGSGALAGCPFPVDRELLREFLGFKRVSENSLDAVADRDWVAEMAFAGAMLGIHLSRLGEDLVIFSSREFGLLALPEGFCTGSSLMPQKRNPDVAELVRGKSGRLLGNLHGLLALLKGLPSGYNRDLQEDKAFLFDTVDTLLLALPAMAGAVGGAIFQEDGARARLDPGMLATDLADYLVRKGVPFRESHQAVGRVVRAAEELGVPLTRLPIPAFQAEHPAFGEDVPKVLSFHASVEARATAGGTARRAVEAQLALAKETLAT